MRGSHINFPRVGSANCDACLNRIGEAPINVRRSDCSAQTSRRSSLTRLASAVIGKPASLCIMVYSAMSPQATDAATFTIDAIAQMMKDAPVTKEAAAEFDRRKEVAPSISAGTGQQLIRAIPSIWRPGRSLRRSNWTAPSN